MEQFLEQLKKAKQRMTLASARKVEIRENLITYMRAHAAMAVKPARAFSWGRLLAPAGMALLLIVAGGGTSAFAEYALPGDLLYPVKLHVNEKIAAALTFSDTDSANLETVLAAKRLEEADTLALQGKLTPTAKSEVEDSFKDHASKAQAKIAELSAKGDASAAADVSSRFESSLQAHAHILAKIEAKDSAEGKDNGEGSDNVRPLKTAVGSVLNRVAKVHTEAESKAFKAATSDEATVNAKGKIDEAANAIQDTEKYLSIEQSALGPDALDAANARLDAAKKLLDLAKSKLEDDAGAAFILANRVLQTTQKVKVLADIQIQAGKSGAAATVAAPTAPMRAAAPREDAASLSAPAPGLNFLSGDDSASSTVTESEN